MIRDAVGVAVSGTTTAVDAASLYLRRLRRQSPTRRDDVSHTSQHVLVVDADMIERTASRDKTKLTVYVYDYRLLMNTSSVFHARHTSMAACAYMSGTLAYVFG